MVDEVDLVLAFLVIEFSRSGILLTEIKETATRHHIGDDGFQSVDGWEPSLQRLIVQGGVLQDLDVLHIPCITRFQRGVLVQHNVHAHTRLGIKHQFLVAAQRLEGRQVYAIVEAQPA